MDLIEDYLFFTLITTFGKTDLSTYGAFRQVKIYFIIT